MSKNQNCTCGCDESCTCGCQEGKPCTCGCNCSENSDKEIAFELCRALIEGRTYTADSVAEAFKKIYEAVKSCQ